MKIKIIESLKWFIMKCSDTYNNPCVNKYYMVFQIIPVFHRNISIPLAKIMVYNITLFLGG